MKAIEKKHHVTINGPAGTGKTTLTKFIIEALISTGETGIILAAPTTRRRKSEQAEAVKAKHHPQHSENQPGDLQMQRSVG
jgi:ABC-type Mn2+/Zn2+ transport system ATPase subunit